MLYKLHTVAVITSNGVKPVVSSNDENVILRGIDKGLEEGLPTLLDGILIDPSSYVPSNAQSHNFK